MGKELYWKLLVCSLHIPSVFCAPFILFQSYVVPQCYYPFLIYLNFYEYIYSGSGQELSHKTNQQQVNEDKKSAEKKKSIVENKVDERQKQADLFLEQVRSVFAHQ